MSRYPTSEFFDRWSEEPHGYSVDPLLPLLESVLGSPALRRSIVVAVVQAKLGGTFDDDVALCLAMIALGWHLRDCYQDVLELESIAELST